MKGFALNNTLPNCLVLWQQNSEVISETTTKTWVYLLAAIENGARKIIFYASRGHFDFEEKKKNQKNKRRTIK